MQSIKSRKFIGGLVALGLMLAISFFASQSVYAETEQQPTAESTTLPTEPAASAYKAPAAPKSTTAPVKPQYPKWSGSYYYDKNGKRVTGFQTIGGKFYSFDSSGRKQVNVYRFYKSKLFRFGSNGVGQIYTGFYNKKYYRSGALGTGAYKGTYYKNGTPLNGYVNKKLYRSGKLYSGVSGSYYYRYGIKQTRYKSTVKRMNNGKIYYFQKNRKVYNGTSWKRIKGKRYYFRKGTALTGWNYVGKYKYYFYSNGSLCQDLISRFGNQWKKKKIVIKVNRRKNCITLYAKDGRRGYTIPVKAMSCSVGKAATPTVKGTYYLRKSRTYRWAKLGGPTMGGYCYGQYCSRITGSYLFHSVTYNRPNNRTLSSKAYNNLGKPASHGCIRLQTSNAKIIYDIARYRKTKVTIYDGRSAGPFDKPKVKKIKSSRNYDPTDPNIKKKKRR